MKNKLVSLCDMVKLIKYKDVSEHYIRYICGLDSKNQYRHYEIEDINSLLSKVSLSINKLSGFIYGYVIPQLNREFDLLKITNCYCLNIELKSNEIENYRIKRQLFHNKHYLKLLNKELHLFTYISSSNLIYTLNDLDELEIVDFNIFRNILNKIEDEAIDLDLDRIFAPKNTLVSPLNATDKFLSGDYILTENQENIKNNIINYIETNLSKGFVGLTGGPGTGKTLVIYDLAKQLSLKYRILIIHSGILCDGHIILNNKLNNVKIIAAKELRLREIKDVDIVIVDEAHRLYTESLRKVERWAERAKTICIFSYDAGQFLSRLENIRNTAHEIDTICGQYIYKLKNKIRTNQELALFITCVFDLAKYRSEYLFPNAKIIYEPNDEKAKIRIKELESEGYTYISFTPSVYHSYLDNQASKYNTHNVIGQEFDGVCMMMNNQFIYDSSGKLNAINHPNPDYIFTQLLYQGLTRVRNKIAIVITSTKLLSKLLVLMENN